jgi:hypothetical protein
MEDRDDRCAVMVMYEVTLVANIDLPSENNNKIFAR